ncbi:MAG: hypothetical protein GW859_05560 [Sphingomonadales bacterium]|nr:hypothetical protein [Sphingomonadales bacterium]
MNKFAYLGLATTVLLSSAATGNVPNVDIASSSYAFGISGYVPVICRASVGASMVAPAQGQVSLGALKEFCNSPNGYAIHADYSPSLADAKIIVDGREVDLDTGGSTQIVTSPHAAIMTRDVVLDLPEGVTSGTMSFRIDPL